MPDIWEWYQSPSAMRRQKEAPLFECVIVLSGIYRLLERSIVLFKRAPLIRPMVSIVLRPSSSVSSKGNLSSDEITPGRLPGVPEILGCQPVCRLNWKKVALQLGIWVTAHWNRPETLYTTTRFNLVTTSADMKNIHKKCGPLPLNS